ncbi:hypothetical protein ACTPOK_10335 [Streptomyces inhibens]|uniref:hypothetical protein n=1 Tax=Streptomyces inhibens TaxID=2293571 RepID=UPI00402AC3F9
MQKDRYHHQSPLWAVDSSAEIIMPPTARNETLSADALAVTVRGSAAIAVLTLAFIVVTGTAENVATVALAMACIRAARGTQLTYRRIRRLADDERHGSAAGSPVSAIRH